MTKVTVVLNGINYGNIRYVSGQEAEPETKHVEGNVTTHTPARPELPAHFVVSHMIDASTVLGPQKAHNIFSWHTLVPSPTADGSYLQVEDEAAHQIAGALRDLADQIEATVKDADQRRSEAASKGAG